jgi:DsbC/DsbD-like thiol-disulfide interchange protein
MNWAIIITPVCLLMGNEKWQPADIVKIMVPEIVAHTGKSTVLKMKVEIKKGYHIQANKVNDDFLITTKLEITEYKNIITGIQQFPPPKKFKLDDPDILLDVYDGVFAIRIPVTVEKEISKGKHILKANLQYQACDNKTCLFPKTIAFSFTIKVI